jgi:hypothetical protein
MGSLGNVPGATISPRRFAAGCPTMPRPKYQHAPEFHRGLCEIAHSSEMVRGYYRGLQVPANGYPGAEREVAEEVARMTSESE